jgi:hypothetical protein
MLNYTLHKTGRACLKPPRVGDSSPQKQAQNNSILLKGMIRD